MNDLAINIESNDMARLYHECLTEVLLNFGTGANNLAIFIAPFSVENH